MAGIIRGSLHAGALAVMTWGYLELSGTVIDTWIRTQTDGHWQVLTIQRLGLAWVTTLLSLISDLIPSMTVVRPLKRALFMIAMPLAVVISSIYWTLLLAFPQLILKEAPQTGQTVPSSSPEVPALARLPLVHDLSLHAAPGPTLLLDFFFFERKYSPAAARYAAPLASIAYCVGYSAWVEYCAKQNKAFPYPFLENSFETRVIVYAGETLIALVSFWTLNGLKRD